MSIVPWTILGAYLAYRILPPTIKALTQRLEKRRAYDAKWIERRERALHLETLRREHEVKRARADLELLRIAKKRAEYAADSADA